MPEPGALLLDLDGTLVDTADANFAAYAMALGEAGIAVPRADFDRLATGRHWSQFLPALMERSTLEPAAIAARKQQIYPSFAAQTRLNRPLFVLASAARATMKVGLVTSASRQSAQAVLTVHALESVFDTVVTGDDVMLPKPAPDAYLLAARRLGLAPGQCLAVEDSDTGAESARRAGMTVLHLATASFSG